MTKPQLFALLILLALLGSLSCEQSKSARAEAGQVSAVKVQNEPAADPAVADSHTGDPENARTTASSSSGFTDEDFKRHISQLNARIKRQVPSGEFAIIIQKPFVVIGDDQKQAVQEHADTTVKWAVDRLKLDFFTKDPNKILDIWLFKNEASYRKHVRLLFGGSPSTPFGYYSPAHQALVMNIGTGGGTLVHEIVHPFMEANFPACPPWLNEGLGSLYEQCGEEDGHIYGYTNWRLPGLQKAITAKRVPSFKTLTAMDTSTFYNEDRGTNYAQSRYLCYYLQEKGLLVTFYREFLAKQKTDPTGFHSLRKILGEPDMDAFKIKWEKFVMGLRQGYAVTVE